MFKASKDENLLIANLWQHKPLTGPTRKLRNYSKLLTSPVKEKPYRDVH
jgi:hypothetical protein